MLHFFRVALFLCCTLVKWHYFHVALFSCCIISYCNFPVMHFFHATLISSCIFLVVHSFHVALFSCFICFRVASWCTLFMLHFFVVALFWVALFRTFFIPHLFSCCFMLNSFHVALFSRYTLFVLHSFHVAVFSCCTLVMLHLFRVALSWCYSSFKLHYFHVLFFSYCSLFILNFFCGAPFCILFTLHLFSCWTLFMLHLFLLHIFSCSTLFMFSCCNFFHVTLFSSLEFHFWPVSCWPVFFRSFFAAFSHTAHFSHCNLSCCTHFMLHLFPEAHFSRCFQGV